MCLAIFFPFSVSHAEAVVIKTLHTGPQFSRMFIIIVGSSQDEGLTLAAKIYNLLIMFKAFELYFLPLQRFFQNFFSSVEQAWIWISHFSMEFSNQQVQQLSCSFLASISKHHSLFSCWNQHKKGLDVPIPSCLILHVDKEHIRLISIM